MVLAYEYKTLLNKRENEREVIDILNYLDKDIITPEMLVEQKQLINRLRNIGEERIAEKLVQND